MSAPIDFLAQYQPTQTTVQALYYLDNFAKQGHWDNGFSYEKQLRACRLDYSLGSLKRIDQLLDQIRTKVKPNYEAFLNNPANANFLCTVGFYCGEMRGRLMGVAPTWLHYPELMEKHPELQPMLLDPVAYQFTAHFEREADAYQHFPWVAMLEQLFPQFEEPEKSVYFSTITGNYQQYGLDDVIPPAPPQQLTIDVASEIAKLPKEYLLYLQMLPPDWVHVDELAKQIKQLAHLYNHGRVVWASLVQANNKLFEFGNTISCPAELIYDKSGRTPPEQLREYAHQLFELKNTTPTDPELASYAKHITNEYTRFVGKIPHQISHMPLYACSLFVWLPHLPNGVLTFGTFPIIIADDTDEVMILPAKFWQHTEYYQRWILTQAQQNKSNTSQVAENDKSPEAIAIRHIQAHARHDNANAYPAFIRHHADIYQYFEDLLYPNADSLKLADNSLFDDKDFLQNAKFDINDVQFLQMAYRHMKYKHQRWQDIDDLPSQATIDACIASINAKEVLNINEFPPNVQLLAKLRLFNWQAFLQQLTLSINDSNLPYTKPLPKVALALEQPSLTADQSAKLLSFLTKASEADFNELLENEKAGIANITKNNTTALLYLAYLYATGKHAPQLVRLFASKINYASGLEDYRATYWIAELVLAIPELAPLLFEQQSLRESSPLSMHYMNQMMTGNSQISISTFDSQRKAYLHNRNSQLELVRQSLIKASSQGHPTAQKRLQQLIENNVLPAKAQERYENVQFWIMDYVNRQPAKQNARRNAVPLSTEQPRNWGIFVKLGLVLVIGLVIKSCFFNHASDTASSARVQSSSENAQQNTNTTTPSTTETQNLPAKRELNQAITNIHSQLPYDIRVANTLTLIGIENQSGTAVLTFDDKGRGIMSIQAVEKIYCIDRIFEPLQTTEATVKFHIVTSDNVPYDVTMNNTCH
ncbi:MULTISPECIES: hypothetical protein [unclassified Moraxella]|uniref:hypothetical protein n=1 Tax=unclassified Moraxella TaxID=2685852 RepID=UPI003AF888E7